MANALEPQNTFTPACTATGAYESVQCHPVSRECWCVSKSGYEVVGTRVAPGEDAPICKGKSRKLYSIRPKWSERKKNRSKTKFVNPCDNIIKDFLNLKISKFALTKIKL